MSDALAKFDVSLPPDELQHLLQRYMAHLYSGAYVIDGMREVLEYCRAQGWKVGAITNYKYGAGMRGLLQHAGLTELLDGVWISAEIGVKKPALDIYQRALSDFHVDPVACVLVGNEFEKDLATGARLGMETILFEPDEHRFHDREFAEHLQSLVGQDGGGPEHVCQTAGELHAILAEVGQVEHVAAEP